MPDTEVLQSMGLSKNEAKIYMALLSLGSAPVTEIMRKSGVHRANIYDVLEKLMEKALVTSVVRVNKKYFECAPPANIHAILKEKEKELESIMPGLEAVYNQHEVRQEIHHFKGKEGLKAVLRDINRYKTYDAFGISSNIGKILHFYFPQWVQERLRKKLFARMIKAKGDRLMTPQLFGMKAYKKLFHVRDIPMKYYTPTATWIYGNKVAIILESMENPLAVIIESDEIADGYRKQFEHIWIHAKDENTSIYQS